MIAAAIQAALNRLPAEMLNRSGSVFYTGRSAFAQQSAFYILGLNPGGSPTRQVQNTIGRDLLASDGERREHWSAYSDESWEGRLKGTHGMQPRMIHMFAKLGLNPRHVPASNVVFVRSPDEATLETEKTALLQTCWPVHEAVLGSLGVRCVLALGTTAGRWIRQKLAADVLTDQYREENDRGWKSVAHRAADGRTVVTVTHPGRADWRNPASDPTDLISKALRQSS